MGCFATFFPPAEGRRYKTSLSAIDCPAKGGFIPSDAAPQKNPGNRLTGGAVHAILTVPIRIVQQTAAASVEKRKGESGVISLNYRDARPIYEQIKDELRKLIVSGALAADERLPSVRALAAQLAINPNTIQRSYNELEAEGYTYSVPGKGSFAAGSAAAGKHRREELIRQIRELIRELRYLGLSQEDFMALVKEELE